MMPGHGEHSSLGISKEEYAIFVQKEHPADLSGDVLWTGNKPRYLQYNDDTRYI